MADDEIKDSAEDATPQDAPEGETPQSEAEPEPAVADAGEAAEPEAQAEPEPEAAAEDAGGAAAPEAPAEPQPESESETPAEGATGRAESGEDSGEPTPAAAAAEDEGEPLSPKERRRRSRAHHVQARPPRSPEERQAERRAERAAKAERRRARRVKERAKAKERAAARGPQAELAAVHSPQQGSRRVRQGVVISDKASKTITVRIDVARRHRRYEKIVRSSTTLHAHDEADDAREGDVVRVVESRPLSRTKRWRLLDVVERAQ